jgi:hypothetical protein
VPVVDDRAAVESVCFSCGLSNPCDACVAARDWLRLFSLDQRGVFLHYFHIVFSKDMWNVGFISSMCIRNASSSLFVIKLTLIFGP